MADARYESLARRERTSCCQLMAMIGAPARRWLFGQVMDLTLAIDHRPLDGAGGAQFLQMLSPSWRTRHAVSSDHPRVGLWSARPARHRSPGHVHDDFIITDLDGEDRHGENRRGVQDIAGADIES
jgi:hypothetical protein